MLAELVLHWACIGVSAVVPQVDTLGVDRASDNDLVVARRVVTLSSTLQADRNSPVLDHVHALLQLPLNHLGMVVESHGFAAGPPVVPNPESVRGVVLFLQPGDELPGWVIPWLARSVDEHGWRVVHLGSLNPLARPRGGAEVLETWLARFDLGWDAAVVDRLTRVEARAVLEQPCRYEGPSWGPAVHRGPWNLSNANRVWLETADLDDVDGGDGAGRSRTPVVTGPWGGLALDPWVVRVGGEAAERRWHVDPFAFFEEALGLRGVPTPDPAVVNGLRAFVFHVDGDGFESESTVVDGQIAGQVFLDQIVDRYSLPMSVSVIVAGLTDDIAIEAETARMQIAREIFARPHVEAASHAVLHPMNWRRRKTKRTAPRTVTWYDGLENYRHDMVSEVRESVRFIDERLLPAGKRCEMMFWSGFANPSEEALLEVERLGIHSLNGGVYRWDSLSDSVGFVSPWGKQVGRAFQVYCGAPNENVYDGFFTTMPGAFRHVSTTLENTGRDRILKPADLYVHFYSAERPPRLRALQSLIDRWAFAEPTAPVFASDYAKAVVAAQSSCRVLASADGSGWKLRDFGACRTARIEHETRDIDWDLSVGIAGALRVQDRLFVHLDEGDADLVFMPPGRPAPARPHVEKANHILRSVVRSRSHLEIESDGYGARYVVCSGFSPGARIERIVSEEVFETFADEVGRVRVEWNGVGRTRVTLRSR